MKRSKRPARMNNGGSTSVPRSGNVSAMSIGAQIEYVSRLRVQPRDYLPSRRTDGKLAGAFVGVGSVANPFLGFGDESLIGWPSAGFARDWSALSQDFWRALGDYTRTADDAHALPDGVVG